MQPRLVPFSQIYVEIPRQLILSLFKSGKYPTKRQLGTLNSKLNQLEKAENRIRHVRSIIERIKLRGYEG